MQGARTTPRARWNAASSSALRVSLDVLRWNSEAKEEDADDVLVGLQRAPQCAQTMAVGIGVALQAHPVARCGGVVRPRHERELCGVVWREEGD